MLASAGVGQLNENMLRVKPKQTHPRVALFRRMGLWGTAVSALSGWAYFLAIAFGLPYMSEMPFDVALSGLFFGSFMSALVGLVYGLLAAHFIGLAMALTAAAFFPEGRRPRLHKITFAAITAIPIYLVSPLDAVRSAFALILEGSSANPLADWTAMAIYAFAIYLSQIVARTYLREISARKRKEKPACDGVLLVAGDSVDGG